MRKRERKVRRPMNVQRGQKERKKERKKEREKKEKIGLKAKLYHKQRHAEKNTNEKRLLRCMKRETASRRMMGRLLGEQSRLSAGQIKQKPKRKGGKMGGPST